MSEQLLDKKTPDFLTEEALTILSKGYLQEGETPTDMYWRVASTAEELLVKQCSEFRGVRHAFYELLSNGWLGLATPVAANFGSNNKALPISCFVVNVQDSVNSIYSHLHESAMLSKSGGGVGVGLENIRPRGTQISGGGFSNGVSPWTEIFDRTSNVVSQGSTRRGAFSFYIDIESSDLAEFLRKRDHSKGDPKTHIHSNIGVIVSDKFMNRLYSGEEDAVTRFNLVLAARTQGGSPYLLFIDNANRHRESVTPWIKRPITGSNICTEIASTADEHHTMVCCLSSLNVRFYEEWKDYQWNGFNAYHLSIFLLDAVMEYFIEGGEGVPGLERALSYAKKGRPLGLGVVGYHAYLMSQNIPFASKEAREFNIKLFFDLQRETHYASFILGKCLGTTPWSGERRNMQTTAIAPTSSNSVTCGAITPGIEPIAGNVYTVDGLQTVSVRKNPILEEVLSVYGENTREVWSDINIHEGSVQHLSFLSQHEKEVFKIFSEIDQMEIVKQASDRQRYLEQYQSLNFSFLGSTDAETIAKVHLFAYQEGLATLYYQRGDSKSKVDILKGVKEEREEKEDKSVGFLITRPGCPYCDLAKNLFVAYGYKVEESEVEEAIDAGIWEDEWKTVPQIWIGHEYVGGYAELKEKLTGDVVVTSECSGCEG